ncbi:cytochrome o ubiquinol oxidase subunit I [Buchnera aphidicola (Mollitrichosiphum nigrofasciatum)]|uniref:cytochrome o ubiquinol oxidase subunit I n=1 Tax=Buchnera aphidicola TaxID=9 RepID=UPI0031B871B2
MFGNLKLSVIPFHDPIIMTTCIFIIIGVFTIALLLTYFKKWGYIWNKWITSVDHKKIAIMYFILAFVMLFRGFADAIMMRLQQFLASTEYNSAGFLPEHHYNQIFTAHGVIMIFFVAMPLVIGFMNFIVPLQIGARDMAFPYLNSISFWLTCSGAILINLSLGIGEFAQTGWLAYPPLSSIQYSPGVGVDYWIWSLQISGLGTILTSVNFLVTILCMRAKGMYMFRMPVFTWTTLCSNILILVSFPVLAVTLFLLTLDRYLNFHFFTNDFGGNIMMYVNLIWIWGHPEVYILILPAFGIFSEIVATFSKKSLFGYFSLVWATVAITILSFIVWLHHFFTMGAGSNVNTFFGIMTMIIAIPTGVKIFNWLFTMYMGRIYMHSSMLWTIGFLITFTFGGMTGVLMSIPSIDFVLHNSLFLVAHFHNVIIGGVVFGCFAGFNYWFPKFFGFILNEKWGKISFWFWFIGFFIAFLPLYILGFMGMTRRLSQNIDTEFHFLLSVTIFGTLLIFFGILSQIIQIIISIYERKQNIDITGDPWNGRTLEWSIPSPPPFYNFSKSLNISCRDQFWEDKKKLNLNKKFFYEKIIMPKNTSIGIIIAFIASLFGFSAIWHIWWLFTISIIFIILYLVKFSSYDVKHYIVSKKIIKKIEKNHIKINKQVKYYNEK